jgi:hypothetical protein
MRWKWRIINKGILITWDGIFYVKEPFILSANCAEYFSYCIFNWVWRRGKVGTAETWRNIMETYQWQRAFKCTLCMCSLKSVYSIYWALIMAHNLSICTLKLFVLYQLGLHLLWQAKTNLKSTGNPAQKPDSVENWTWCLIVLKIGGNIIFGSQLFIHSLIHWIVPFFMWW